MWKPYDHRPNIEKALNCCPGIVVTNTFVLWAQQQQKMYYFISRIMQIRYNLILLVESFAVYIGYMYNETLPVTPARVRLLRFYVDPLICKWSQ